MTEENIKQQFQQIENHFNATVITNNNEDLRIVSQK